jgi:hypothetical protein
VRARDALLSPTIVSQGLTAGDARGLDLQRYVPDGCWAEQVRVPTENAISIGSIDEREAPAWATLGAYLVPYGGLTAAGLEAGETVVVNGATGSFGSAGVADVRANGDPSSHRARTSWAGAARHGGAQRFRPRPSQRRRRARGGARGTVQSDGALPCIPVSGVAHQSKDRRVLDVAGRPLAA